jgi:hypothetical protein
MHQPPIRQGRTASLSSPHTAANREHGAPDPRTKDGSRSEMELARCRAEIAKLLPLWPRELADMSPAGRAHVVAALERALRAERRRGLAGHWTYNLARHMQLLRAYRAEMAAGRAMGAAHGRRRTGNPERRDLETSADG